MSPTNIVEQNDEVTTCLNFGAGDLNDEMQEMWKVLEDLDCYTGYSGVTDDWNEVEATRSDVDLRTALGQNYDFYMVENLTTTEAKYNRVDYNLGVHDPPSYYQVEEMNIPGEDRPSNNRAHLFLVPSQYQLSDLHMYSALHNKDMAYQYKLHELITEPSKYSDKQQQTSDGQNTVVQLMTAKSEYFITALQN